MSYIKTYYNKLIMSLITLGMFPNTVMAALNDSGLPFVPSFDEGWAGVPETVQGRIIWLVGIALVMFAVSGIISVLWNSIKAMWGGGTNNVSAKSEGMTGVIAVIGIFVLVTIAAVLLAVLL
jgi:hypothetical protein